MSQESLTFADDLEGLFTDDELSDCVVLDDTNETNVVSDETSDNRVVIELEQQDAPNKSNLRKNLLLTLTHVDRQCPNMSLNDVYEQMKQVCKIVRAVGCTEVHEEMGFHYHMAIENTTASKHSIAKRVRLAFPDFPGRMVDVSTNHKSWMKMLTYVTKEDENYECFSADGLYTREIAQEELECKRGKVLNAVYTIRQHIDAGGSIASMVRDDDVAPFMLRSATSVTQFARYVQQSSERESFLKAVDRVGASGSIHTAQQFLNDSQKSSLWEFMAQMQGRRPRQPQVYCVGDSCTGKTYPFMLLAQHLPGCFIPCLENNERAFAQYDDSLHDWILINDFHDNVRFQLLSNLCEGSLMTLNSYGGQTTKKNNCPVIFTANQLPQYKNLDRARITALHNRLIPITFTAAVPGDSEMSVEDLCALLIIYGAMPANPTHSPAAGRGGKRARSPSPTGPSKRSRHGVVGSANLNGQLD
jgi:hypothetical protein